MIKRFLDTELRTYKGNLLMLAAVDIVLAAVVWIVFGYLLGAQQWVDLALLNVAIAARTLPQFVRVFIFLAGASAGLIAASLLADDPVWWVTSGLSLILLTIVGVKIRRMRSDFRRLAYWVSGRAAISDMR